MSRKGHGRWPSALAVAAGVALVVGLLGSRGSLEPLELRGLDLMFRARHAVHGPRPVDPRILLVLLDEATFQRFGRPMALWGAPLAQSISALRGAGARVVALDLVLRPELGGLAADDPVALRVAEGEEALAGAILAGGAVIIEYLGQDGTTSRSSEFIHFAADARQAVGVANVVLDPDGAVRRVPLLFVGQDPPRTRSLAGVLAERATGRPLTLRQGQAWLGDVPVPADPPAQALRIDFPGPPGTVPAVSLAGLLDRVRAGQRLDGRVCLVAPGTADMQDLHATPLGGNMLGGEVQAAALNTLLSGRFVLRAPWWSSLLAVWTACLVAGLLAFAWHPLRSLVALLGLLLVYLALALELFARTGAWPVLAAPVLGGLAAWSAGYALRYLTVEREGREVQGILGRYVSPQVMAELLTHPESLQLGGSRRRMTFLFSDINEFSDTCSRSAPEEVIAMLNLYLQEMVALVFAHGGTVKQFVGDEIMALYGAPEPCPDHAARAVRTAVEMVERLERMEVEAAGTPGFYRVKIGVHTGDAVVGSVGSWERAEYAAVGDDVNIAARIEARAKQLGATLLVSEATRLEAEAWLSDMEWISRGDQELKGIGRPIPVYEVRRRLPAKEEQRP